MSTPQLRKKVRFSFEGKNLSLTELRGAILKGDVFYSIEPHVGGIHNTKLIIYLKDEEERIISEEDEGDNTPTKRVIFYNRIDINSIVPKDYGISLRGIATTIRQLNAFGCDFTTDDLEYRDGYLAAKTNSLGYFGVLKDNPYLRDWTLLVENSNFRILTDQNKAIQIEER